MPERSASPYNRLIDALAKQYDEPLPDLGVSYEGSVEKAPGWCEVHFSPECCRHTPNMATGKVMGPKGEERVCDRCKEVIGGQ